MAKKRKVVIVDQELTPTVLATLENKKTNLFGLILLFIIFGGVVYYLPEISVYIEQYLNPTVSGTGTNPSGGVSEKPKEDDEVKENEKYPYATTLKITTENFYLSDFNIANNYLSFRITNTAKVSVPLDDFHYYLELFNTEGTLLQRIKVDDGTIEVGASIQKDYELMDVNLASVSFVEIGEDEYPAFTATANTQGAATLVCQKGNEKVSYTLRNNKVLSFEETFETSRSDSDFATLFSTYQALSTTYNAINGITSSVTFQGDDKLVFRTTISLSNDSAAIYINKMVYPLNTDAKVIRFEAMARGYTCD
ncbi:MAG: hypothetical protein K2M17_03390 [Bacilli bacterium]|nr:hypothetical protein [Bacilli bacterium]